MVSESSRGSSSAAAASFRLCRLFAHGHNTCRRMNVAVSLSVVKGREAVAGGDLTHLQQAVGAALLQEGLAGLVPPRVSAGHLQLQLPQLLHEDRQVSADGHQALQVIQAGVVFSVLHTDSTVDVTVSPKRWTEPGRRSFYLDLLQVSHPGPRSGQAVLQRQDVGQLDWNQLGLVDDGLQSGQRVFLSRKRNRKLFDGC